MQETKKTVTRSNPNPFLEILNNTEAKRKRWLKELDIENLSTLITIFNKQIDSIYKEQLESFEAIKECLDDATKSLKKKGLTDKDVTKLVITAVNSLGKDDPKTAIPVGTKAKITVKNQAKTK